MNFNGQDMLACRCGFDHADARSAPLTYAEGRGTRVIFGLLGDLRFEPEAAQVMELTPFQDMGAPDIVGFLCRVSFDLHGRPHRFFSIKPPVEAAHEAHLAITAGLRIADEWPTAFHGYLDGLLLRGTSNRRDALRAVQRRLEGLPENEGQEMRRAFADYRGTLSKRLRNGRRRANRNSVHQASAER